MILPENRMSQYMDEERRRLETTLSLVIGTIQTMGYEDINGLMQIICSLLSGHVLSMEDVDHDEVFESLIKIARRHYQDTKESIK